MKKNRLKNENLLVMSNNKKKVMQEEKCKHPCYSKDASHQFARIHLPVAPQCNIQCNYCNRKYDCCNESRPGVTSSVISPQEALTQIVAVKRRLPQLSVAGIAGPGDPLANPEKTFTTFALIKATFPHMLLCLSTNGLMVPDNITIIKKLGISHITITINTLSPQTGTQIYRNIRFNGKWYHAEEGVSLLIEKQLAGLKLLKAAGVLCKVNSVMIPGINQDELPAIAKKIKTLGAFMHNIMPLIPCEGSHFHKVGIRRPSITAVKEMNLKCGGDMKMMHHCQQCRADAVGFLGNDEGGCSNSQEQRQQVHN